VIEQCFLEQRASLSYDRALERLFATAYGQFIASELSYSSCHNCPFQSIVNASNNRIKVDYVALHRAHG
jgi:hypothetical protein